MATTSSGSVRAAAIQNRRLMSPSSGFSTSSAVTMNHRARAPCRRSDNRPARRAPPRDASGRVAAPLRRGYGGLPRRSPRRGRRRVAGAGCWVRRGPSSERDGDRRGDVVHAALVRRQLQGLFADRLRTSSGSRQNRSNTSHLRARAIAPRGCAGSTCMPQTGSVADARGSGEDTSIDYSCRPNRDGEAHGPCCCVIHRLYVNGTARAIAYSSQIVSVARPGPYRCGTPA